MIDFQRFETFDPNGLGLGNLFGQISPFEALGIWPSGDFRLAPGDGAVPALGYFLGAAFARSCSSTAPAVCWRRRETAVLAALLAVLGIYAAARLGGTPYTTAKAIVVGGADRRPRHRPAPPAPPGGMAVSPPRRRLLAARLRQRPGRSLVLLTRPDRAASGRRRRGRRSSSPRGSCSRTNRASPTSPGSCAAVESASRASRRPALIPLPGSASSSPRTDQSAPRSATSSSSESDPRTSSGSRPTPTPHQSPAP